MVGQALAPRTIRLDMTQDTKEQFIDTAEALFAERGFYGVSIAAIADELGLTKQALLHHFGSKEKLYGAVLARISARFDAQEAEAGIHVTKPEARLVTFFLGLYAPSPQNTQQTRLLMRELLDNKQRADTAATWYLQPFLARLIGMVQAVPNWANASDAEALALAYQWLGAINYFVISAPTLSGIFGAEEYERLNAAFPHQLEALMLASLSGR